MSTRHEWAQKQACEAGVRELPLLPLQPRGRPFTALSTPPPKENHQKPQDFMQSTCVRETVGERRISQTREQEGPKPTRGPQKAGSEDQRAAAASPPSKDGEPALSDPEREGPQAEDRAWEHLEAATKTVEGGYCVTEEPRWTTPLPTAQKTEFTEK